MTKGALQRGGLGDRVFIVDVQDEYDVDKFYGHLGTEKRSVGQAIQNLERGQDKFKWRFVLHPASEEINDVFALALAVGNCVIIAEETPLYRHNQWLETVLLRGRRRGVRCLCTTQRPYTFSRTVSSQCAALICFYTDEPRDVEYIRKRYGKAAETEFRSLAPPSPERVECCVFGDTDLFKPFRP